jgi:hypothetical protein
MRRAYQSTFFEVFEIFRSDFRKYCNCAFELLVQRNRQTRDKKIEGKEHQEKSFFLSHRFFGKKFLTWTSPKKFYGVFELPLLRNAEIRHEKKATPTKGTYPYPIYLVAIHLLDTRRFQLLFSSAPLVGLVPRRPKIYQGWSAPTVRHLVKADMQLAPVSQAGWSLPSMSQQS